MIGYIYRITVTNTESSLYGCNYIGLHLAESFDKYYFGSGRIIKDYRKKYGRKGLHKEILDVSNDVDELMDLEIYYISFEWGLHNNINIQKGGKLANTGITVRKGFKMSQESINKMKETKRKNPRIFTDEEKLKLSEKLTGEGNHMYGVNVKDRMTPEKYEAMLEKRRVSMTGKMSSEKNPMFNSSIKNEDIVLLYNKKYSIDKIAEELGCDYSLIYKRLKTLQLDTKAKRLNKDEVKKFHLEGKTRKEIASLLGCTPSRVGQVIRELKI